MGFLEKVIQLNYLDEIPTSGIVTFFFVSKNKKNSTGTMHERNDAILNEWIDIYSYQIWVCIILIVY